jgi:hypothetical protein
MADQMYSSHVHTFLFEFTFSYILMYFYVEPYQYCGLLGMNYTDYSTLKTHHLQSILDVKKVNT